MIENMCRKASAEAERFKQYGETYNLLFRGIWSAFVQYYERKKIMKNCNYPKCTECTLPDCEMDEKDIAALLKRRRWASEPELYRKKQKERLQKQD